MRGRGWPRSELADCLIAIRISPTFVPVGPVCTRSSAASSAVPESNSRHARSTSQPPSVARSTVPASTIAPASPSGRRCRPCRRRGSPAARPRAAAARRPSARCVLRPPRPWLARQCHGRLPAPDHSVGRRARAAPREARPAPLPRRLRSASHASSSSPMRMRGVGDRAHRSVDIRDDVSLMSSAVPASRPNNPEPMTSGSSPGTSETNSASARPSAEQARDAAALEARKRRALRIQRRDVPARGEAALVERARGRRGDARAQRSTRLDAPPDTRNNGVTDPAAMPRSRRFELGARGETACRRERDARFRAAVTRGAARELGIDVAVLGDDQHADRWRRPAHRSAPSVIALAALPTAKTATRPGVAGARAGTARRTRGRPPRAARRRTVRAGCGARS